jgi:hypothetical protein
MAEERLRQIVEARRQDKVHKKLDFQTRKYLPSFGITSVAPLSLSARETFGAPLWALLQGNPDVEAAVALLPLASLHVTIRGLEDVMDRPDAATVLRELDEAFVKTCSQSSVLAARPGSQDPLLWKVRELSGWKTALVLLVDVEPQFTLDMLNHHLRDKLQLPPFHQEYHMTIGYWLSRDEQLQRNAVQGVNKALASVHNQANVYTLQTPRVCAYESMEAFPPLFE